MYPTLFSGSPFQIYLYPLFMGLAWGMSYRLSERLLIREKGHARGLVLFFVVIFLSSWIGAKILFLMVTKNLPENVAYNSNFWLGGGFVFIGGMIFAICAGVILLKITNRFSYDQVKAIIPAAPIAHGIGRIGCIFAGCCYGEQTDFWVSIHLHGANRHPVQLYEAVLLLIVGLWMIKKPSKDPVLFYLLLYAFIRFNIEFIRGDELRGIYHGLSTSQWVSLLLALSGSLVFLYRRQKSKDLLAR